MAQKAGVPVLPVFVTMRDGDTSGADGYPVQKHTVHIMPPVYPDTSLPPKACSEKMRADTFESYRRKYREAYGAELES